MHRVLDAEDLLKSFQTEVKRAQETVRVTTSRNNGLMNENRDLTKRLKSALAKIERAKKPKGQPEPEPEPEYPVDELVEEEA